MKTVKWVIILQNIACGIFWQWEPPPLHSSIPSARLDKFSDTSRDDQAGDLRLEKNNINKPKKFRKHANK